MRVAIVNDLLIAVEALRVALEDAPWCELAWVARDGAEAVRSCILDRPDVILMDLIMPVMDGVEATRQIMQTSPCAILIVTATVAGNAEMVFKAMGHGALDAVNTPIIGTGGHTRGSGPLIEKLAAVGWRIGKAPIETTPSGTMRINTSTERGQPLVAIGASTGGPSALAQILGGLPATFAAPIIVVQHIDKQFAPGLAHWLDSSTELSVRVAQDGDAPSGGVVLVACTNDHLVMDRGGFLRYTPEPRTSVFRPSADALFTSAVRHWRHGGIGVLLTGIGTDGRDGVRVMQGSGWHTIGQDQETSVVYGMAKAAAEAGAIGEMLPLDEIAGALVRALTVVREAFR